MKDAFVKTITENPNDDAIKLIFADWLDERGDPLGSAIREQLSNRLNLYLISQDENKDWDTFDSAVVAAANEEEARNIHPGGPDRNWDYTWTSSAVHVKVKLIGKATQGVSGVVCASFNAG